MSSSGKSVVEKNPNISAFVFIGTLSNYAIFVYAK
tara:strand:+ start:76883 stop:76987 length:105 start_codon:yes stop_codon:yes gene_type:complete